ncbi:TPR-like protein, partial [Tuber magnatum]
MVPYCRNSTFTGRESVIESIKEVCKSGAHNRVALHGLGGCGKTQIALEYVYRCSSEEHCDVFWVQGSGILKFAAGFRAIAQHVRIPLVSVEEDEEGFLRRVRTWLEGPDSSDWILVIDNAGNDADFIGNTSPIAKFVPQGRKGTVIFTTRSKQVAIRQGCKIINVGKMKLEEALELFSKRFDSWHSLEEEEKGANDKRARELLLERFSDIQREVDMTESILGTYFITFDRIAEQMPLAANLLGLIAFFDRQNIPEGLLTRSGLEGMDDSLKFCRAIGELLRFSLVTEVKYEGTTFYELHRLVQLSIQAYLSTEGAKRGRATALQAISRLFPVYEYKRRNICAAYMSHAQALTRDSSDTIAEALVYRMGKHYIEMGSYNNAEIQVRQCIALRQADKERDWEEDNCSRFLLLGMVLRELGRYEESEVVNRRALEGYEKSLGSDHPYTLMAVNNLALVLRELGRYEESEVMNRRALEGYEKSLGSDHPDTLMAVNNLALVLGDLGRYEDSEVMNRRALEGYEKSLGSDHPKALGAVNNLASVLQKQGRYEKSEVMNRRALEGYEKRFGSDHPYTLMAVNNLAQVLRELGRYEESEVMNRRALEGYEKSFGSDHPRALVAVNNLASVLQKQGRYEESEMMNRRALEGYEKSLGSDHPYTLMAVNNLAQVLRELGRYEESEMMNRRALEGYEKRFGLDHPDTLMAVNNLALVLREQGRYEESEVMNRRALEGYEKSFGSDHPRALVAVSNLASVLQEQGRYQESQVMNRRALEGYEKRFGSDHPDTLMAVNNLAQVLRELGRYEESEVMNCRALEGYEKGFGSDHPYTLMAVNNLAQVLRELGRYEESEVMNR